MEHATKGIYQGFAVILFCLAFSLLITERNAILQLLEISKETLYDTQVVYQVADADMSEPNIVNYSELCSIFCGPLSYDVRVTGGLDSITCLASNYNYMLFDFSTIPVAKEYERIYHYENGNISYVEYKGV